CSSDLPLSPRGLPEPHAVQAACGGPADGAAAPNSCAPGTATRHAGHWRMPGRPPILLIHGIRIDGGRVGGPGIRRADREGDRAQPAPRGAGDPRAERAFGGSARTEHVLLRLDRLRPAPGAPARRAGPLPPGGDDDPLPDRRARGRPAPGGPELPGRHPGVGPWPRPGGGARLPGHGTGDRHRLAHRGDAGAGCALRGRVPDRTSARRGLDPLGRAAAAVGGDPAGPQRRRVLPQRLVRDGAGGGAVPAPAGAGRRLDGRGRRGVARRAPDRPAGPRGLSTRSPRAAPYASDGHRRSRQRYPARTDSRGPLMSTQTTQHARILIVGGGAAGLSVAARLRRSHEHGVVVVEPSDVNYYQPAWSLVGAGLASLRSTVRPEAQVMPRGVTWVRNVGPGMGRRARRAPLADGEQISYETVVVATGSVLDWDAISGLAEARTTPQVSSNYSFDHAGKTWSILSEIIAGTVVFTRAAGKVKCPSAAQKIMYLAADHWRRTGVLDRIRIVFVTPGERIYDKDEFSDTLDTVAADYGIEVRTRCELREIDPDGRKLSILDHADGQTEELAYDALHVVPPQSAAPWIAESGLADPEQPGGWAKVDATTLQHPNFPE